jgi:hypothetical protein
MKKENLREFNLENLVGGKRSKSLREARTLSEKSGRSLFASFGAVNETYYLLWAHLYRTIPLMTF